MKTDFDDAIGVVPPSLIDVDRLIVRGRRRQLVRRIGLAGAGAASVVAVAVTMSLGTGGGGSPGVQFAAPGPSESTAPSPSNSGSPRAGALLASPLPVPSNEPATPPAEARSTEKRLSQAIKDAVHDHAPGYTLSADTGGTSPFKMKYLYISAAPNRIGSNAYDGSANLRGPGGRGNVSVTIGRIGSIWHPRTTCDGFQPDCEVATGPHGEMVVRKVEYGEDSRKFHYVLITRPDGTGVLIVAANQGGQTDLGKPFQAEPVLTFDQLVAIGADARLHA